MIKNNEKLYKVKHLLNPLFLTMFIFLCVYTISVMLPLFWGFIQSLRNKIDVETGSVLGWPDLNSWANNKKSSYFVELGYTDILGNYRNVLTTPVKVQATWIRGIDELFGKEAVTINTRASDKFLLDGLINSVLYAGVGSVLKVLGPSIVGYLCAKYKYKFSTIVYTYVVFVMVTPIMGTTTATLNLVRYLGIYDNWFGLFIRFFTFANMYFLVFYAFFAGISNSYAEAAEIDGASQFSVMVTIYMPLASKMIGTVVLLQFVNAWNDYSTALMYMPTHPTLAFIIYKITQNTTVTKVAGIQLTCAALMMLAVPTLILFVLLKNKLMGNLSLGGVKE